MQNIPQLKIISIIALMGFATIYRVLPHPPNFGPMTAIALFSGVLMGRRYLAMLIPIIVLYISDLIINNTYNRSFFPDTEGVVWFSPYMAINFICFGLFVVGGAYFLKRYSFSKLLIASVSASLIFFLLSNIGSWWASPIYPKNLTGVGASLLAGLPFLKNGLLGDLFFTGVIFGLYGWVRKYYASIKSNISTSDIN